MIPVEVEGSRLTSVDVKGHPKTIELPEGATRFQLRPDREGLRVDMVDDEGRSLGHTWFPHS